MSTDNGPRTTAGKRLFEDGYHNFTDLMEKIVAIEAEAAQGAAPRAEGLDWQRLASAMSAEWSKGVSRNAYTFNEYAKRVAARMSERAAPRAEGHAYQPDWRGLDECRRCAWPESAHATPRAEGLAPVYRLIQMCEALQERAPIRIQAEKAKAALAAPRAESLDVLDHVMELAEQYHSGHSVAGAPCKCDQCRELRVVRRLYARLSRPSDERVPDDDPRNHHVGECPVCIGPCRLPDAAPCLTCNNGPARHCPQCSACPTADGYDCTCVPSGERCIFVGCPVTGVHEHSGGQGMEVSRPSDERVPEEER